MGGLVPQGVFESENDYSQSCANIFKYLLVLFYIVVMLCLSLLSLPRKQVIFHKKGVSMVDEELDRLIDSIREYSVGNYERFDDALPGEMDGFRLNIVLFGMAGSGKSALINTIFECFDLPQPAVTQTTGKEGTTILELCALSSHVALYDTRGFFDLDKIEEGTLLLLFVNFSIECCF